jgi:dihydrofolate reductase
MPTTVALIAAVARNGAIGKNNALLWRLPEDLKFFKRTTLGCPVIMGRKTWDSIGRPLPGRRNMVITRNPAWQAEGAEVFHDLPSALAAVADAPKVFVIGGGELYAQALPMAQELVLTEVDAEFDGDTFFPEWPREAFTEVSRERHLSDEGWDYHFVTRVKRTAPMQLATWNVNSLGVRLPQLLDWLQANPVDALVLQETKLTDDKFPAAELAAAGYHTHWFGQKTYNGVALLSRQPATDVVRNIPGFTDEQARVIAATVPHAQHGAIRVVGAYFPNGQAPDSEKFAYKMA